MLGRADSIFLSFFSLSFSQSFSFSRFSRPQPCLTCPLLSSLLLSLTLFQKAEHFRFYRNVQSSIIEFLCHSRFIMTVRCVCGQSTHLKLVHFFWKHIFKINADVKKPSLSGACTGGLFSDVGFVFFSPFPPSKSVRFFCFFVPLLWKFWHPALLG